MIREKWKQIQIHHRNFYTYLFDFFFHFSVIKENDFNLFDGKHQLLNFQVKFQIGVWSSIILSIICQCVTQLLVWDRSYLFWFYHAYLKHLLLKFLWMDQISVSGSNICEWIIFIPHSFWAISHTFVSTDTPIFVLDLE